MCPIQCPPEASRCAGGIFRLEKRIPYEILCGFDGSCPNVWIKDSCIAYSKANMPLLTWSIVPPETSAWLGLNVYNNHVVYRFIGDTFWPNYDNRIKCKMYNTYVKGVQKNPFFSFLAFNMWFLVVCRKKNWLTLHLKLKVKRHKDGKKYIQGAVVCNKVSEILRDLWPLWDWFIHMHSDL